MAVDTFYQSRLKGTSISLKSNSDNHWLQLKERLSPQTAFPFVISKKDASNGKLLL